MSIELARQFAFDTSLVFGLWNPALQGSPVKVEALFKQFNECVRILAFDANEIVAVSGVHRLAESDQRLVLQERFQINNLSATQVHQVAQLRRDVD